MAFSPGKGKVPEAHAQFIGEKPPFTEKWMPVNGLGLYSSKGLGTFVLWKEEKQEGRLILVKKGVSKLFFTFPVTIPIYFRLINQKTHRQ